MKIYILILCFIALGVSGSYSQTKDDLNKISQYYLIENKFREKELSNISIDKITEKLENIKFIISGSINYEKNISFIDSTYGFRFYSLLHPLTNPEYYTYTLFAIKDSSIIEIKKEKVLEFINTQLYQYLDAIGKEKIIELYEKLRFYREYPKYFNPVINDEIDSLTYGELNKFIEKDMYTLLRKEFTLKKHWSKETYMIIYKFYWNRLDVELKLTSKEY